MLSAAIETFTSCFIVPEVPQRVALPIRNLLPCSYQGSGPFSPGSLDTAVSDDRLQYRTGHDTYEAPKKITRNIELRKILIGIKDLS